MGKRQGPHSCTETSPIKRAINKPMRPNHMCYRARSKDKSQRTDFNRYFIFTHVKSGTAKPTLCACIYCNNPTTDSLGLPFLLRLKWSDRWLSLRLWSICFLSHKYSPQSKQWALFLFTKCITVPDICGHFHLDLITQKPFSNSTEYSRLVFNLLSTLRYSKSKHKRETTLWTELSYAKIRAWILEKHTHPPPGFPLVQSLDFKLLLIGLCCRSILGLRLTE